MGIPLIRPSVRLFFFMSKVSSLSGSLGHFSDFSDDPIPPTRTDTKSRQNLSHHSVELQPFSISPPGSEAPAGDPSTELKLLQDAVCAQRAVIDDQKQTIKKLMGESVSPEEIASLRGALAAKSPLLQLVAAPPISEQRIAKQLRADNSALRREIDEMEVRPFK
jgi:hypothetical protein